MALQSTRPWNACAFEIQAQCAGGKMRRAICCPCIRPLHTGDGPIDMALPVQLRICSVTGAADRKPELVILLRLHSCLISEFSLLDGLLSLADEPRLPEGSNSGL